MSVQVNIPTVTINAGGGRVLNPTPVGNLTLADFVIDRTAGATSLNTRTQDVDVLQVVFEFSKDGGQTWPDSNSQTLAGGTFLNRDGTTKTADHFAISIDEDVDMVQGHVTALVRVSIAGTVNVT